MVARKRNLYRNIWAVLFFFVLFFSPPFLPKIHLFLAVFSIAMLMIFYKKKVMYIISVSEQWKWGGVWLFLFCYAVIIIISNWLLFQDVVQPSHYMSLFNRYFVLLVTVIPCVTYYLAYAKEKQITLEDTLRFMIGAALIETACVFLSFLFDPIHEFFLFFLKKYGDSRLYSNTWYLTIRSYGFAGTLVDVFGLGMGLLAGISLFYGVLHKRRYMLYSILIALAGMMNARTTLIIYAISVGIAILYTLTHVRLKLILQWVAIIGCSVLGLSFALSFLKEQNLATYDWIMNGIKSVQQIFKGEGTSDSLAILFSDGFWSFSDNTFQLLFGSGHSIYITEDGMHSDVGYVNEIWFVGIIGALILYTFMIWLLTRCYSTTKNKLVRLCSIFFLLSYFVFNIKASVLGYNPGASVLFASVCVFLFHKNKTVGEIGGVKLK